MDGFYTWECLYEQYRPTWKYENTQKLILHNCYLKMNLFNKQNDKKSVTK